KCSCQKRQKTATLKPFESAFYPRFCWRHYAAHPRLLYAAPRQQALRVIIPPLASQYLNFVKNSSLAVAIGFPDIVAVVDTVLNQTGQAIECILIVMAAYLTVSLSISLFMNWYNERLALTER
ncbi:hypothetical protein B7L18_032450, partial [Burkholderia cenocepacia]|nr:hypothetical protein [Burkholderia cenocepacia]